jgi:coenzyme F420-dependent glucose-6-phosphate dehydrogenase
MTFAVAPRLRATDPRLEEGQGMVRIGFHASHEQYPPSQLLRCVKLAEQAGFQAASCSDHFHPWSEGQRASGFAWTWLGSALEATKLSLSVVNAPGQRYHPAVIAQAAATLCEMYPDRFWLAIGSGENLNEHITGQPWPAKEIRHQRLEECVAVMRDLWDGKSVDYTGHVRVDRAQLRTLPAKAPLVVGAALTDDTSRWLGGWADGLITAGNDPESLQKNVNAFRAGGGEGKPVYLQIAMAHGPTDEQALDVAYERWRVAGLKPADLADTATPQEFDAKTRSVSRGTLQENLCIAASTDRHAEVLASCAAVGFECIYINPITRDLEGFIDVFAQHVLPQVTI